MWPGIARAVETEPRDDKIIRGASGLEHEVLQVGVDEKRNRLLVISDEPNPRVAALVQQDIQSTFSDGTKVLVARPIILDLGVITRNLVQLLGRDHFRWNEINDHMTELNTLPARRRNAKMSAFFDEVAPLAGAFENAPLRALNQVLTFVQQIANFDFEGTLKSVGKKGPHNPLIRLEPLVSINTIAADIEAGVCPLPLYDFTNNDWEVIRSDIDVDAMSELLQGKNIYQYFFPPPDQTALALIDRGLNEPDLIVDAVNQLPTLGHPLGSPDIVAVTTRVEDLLHALAQGGQVVEGELDLALTQPGLELRAKVKTKPKESVFSKLLRSLRIRDAHFHYHG